MYLKHIIDTQYFDPNEIVARSCLSMIEAAREPIEKVTGGRSVRVEIFSGGVLAITRRYDELGVRPTTTIVNVDAGTASIVDADGKTKPTSFAEACQVLRSSL